MAITEVALVSKFWISVKFSLAQIKVRLNFNL